MKKKVAIVVNSRANYARIKSVLLAVRDSDNLELQLIVGASAQISKYGELGAVIAADGLEVTARFNSVLAGDSPASMAASTGLAILGLTNIFENVKPDIVLTIADRYETMGTAIAASYMNIPLAHTQGGELTGSIDESVRHAITKLSHYHFPSTEKSEEVLLRMGEDPDKIFLTGCPSIDLAKSAMASFVSAPENLPGVGAEIDTREPYIVVLQHPVTTDFENAMAQIQPSIEAVSRMGMQTVWLWPNVDAGSDIFSKELRRARELGGLPLVRFVRNLPPEEYLQLLLGAAAILGNSSSAIREGAFLGVPAVNIGNRQNKRERGPNVLDVPYHAELIFEAAQRQTTKGRYPSSSLFGDGNSGRLITKILEGNMPSYQKEFFEWGRKSA